MKAADCMTRKVIAVRPDTPTQEIAAKLLEYGIGAVPVVDDGGAAIGIVSDGDLLPRNKSGNTARRYRWLRPLTNGEGLSLNGEDWNRTARHIMSSPVLTVSTTADVVEVANLLVSFDIKRVPVVRDGMIVGIISRSDLVKALTYKVAPARDGPAADRSDPIPTSERAAGTYPQRPRPEPSPPPVSDDLTAQGFRDSVRRHEQEKKAQRQEAHRRALDKRHQEINELLAEELTEAAWQHMLHEARMSARKGEKEHLLLQFPCGLCADNGRAVNVPDPSWPTTLRGFPAQIFVRWKHELSERGFTLNARVIDFPDGVPGHIGLFLVWGG